MTENHRSPNLRSDQSLNNPSELNEDYANLPGSSTTINDVASLGDTNGVTRLPSSSTNMSSPSTAGTIVSCAIRIFKRQNNLASPG